MNFFVTLGKNKFFIITILTWFIAQFIKVIIGVIQEKRFNFRWLIGPGGMPSSHCAGAGALTTLIGMEFGYDSAIFAFALVFTLITMFDAQGVRRSTGLQAEMLNKIVEDLYFKKPIREDRLIELIGHTPIQVIVGVALGAFCAYFFNGIL